jgi:small subunit ribosomal protein S20
VASHASALKAHRQNLRHRASNRQYRTRLRHQLKTLRTAMASGQLDEAKASLAETVSLIDKLAGKGMIHDNAAGRYKSRLMRRFAALSAAS